MIKYMIKIFFIMFESTLSGERYDSLDVFEGFEDYYYYDDDGRYLSQNGKPVEPSHLLIGLGKGFCILLSSFHMATLFVSDWVR